ncbi:hypothetical protein [Streptomyces violascens]|uniref:Uncharacterized protein n=1 Tax=Streptomyces violascens TaxID=67381 RepID=A0ABQ3QV80_9ACTN|nr:hypothetical protein [Streptomyces violascens]GGU44231.1 hypothetical protein GCM10010289_76140 [Streptomyces violascens]GHI41181.1 hypothetical protein Sviol_55890 [Streptomyces violascens]
MITPAKVPSYTGDVGAVEIEAGRLRKAAQTIREHGGDVNTRFRHLHTVYRAPEAEYLFQTTQGVHDTSASFASKLETVAGALETYASEIRPLVDKLERLRSEAAAFVASVQGQGDFDPQWHHNREKTAAHDALMHEVAATVRAFQDAEVATADTITSVVHGTQWHLANGSPKQSNPYGFSNEQLNADAKLPWGTPEHFSVLPFELDWHIQQFGESIGDNIKGAVTGLVDMFRPGEKGQETRKGLLMTIAGAEDYLRDPDGDRPFTWVGTEGRPYAKAFGKSLVGWDDWKTNPGKATGTVVFNLLTFASGPLGAASKVGAAGKAGEAASAAARTAGVLSKVGEVLDPVGATAKVVGAGVVRTLPKVSELAKNIAAVSKVTSEAHGVHTVLEWNGSKLHLGDGEFSVSKDGVANMEPAPHESAPDQHAFSKTTPPREHELVGVGGRAPEAHAHAGEHQQPHASHVASGGADGHGASPARHSPDGSRAGHAAGSPGSDVGPIRPRGGGHTGSGSGGHGGAGQQHGGGSRGGSREHDAQVADEILRRQVDRANADPEWRKRYFYSTGRRRSLALTDEFGDTLQSHLKPTGDPARPWTADVEKLNPYYLPRKEVGNVSTVHPDHLQTFHDHASRRHYAIKYDEAAKHVKEATAADPTAHELAKLETRYEYKSTHTAMGNAGEDLGEYAAEFHAIQDHYPGATRLDDGARGAHRFDQIWMTDDKRFVVVEAKADIKTSLNYKTIGNRKYSQGRREYWDAILGKMEDRGEITLAEALDQARVDGRLDYVSVKAISDGDKYTGYEMKYFNIARKK